MLVVVALALAGAAVAALAISDREAIGEEVSPAPAGS
jgi:hypothetical protein